MDKWESIGQAFENLGARLRDACIDLGEICETDETYEELYSHYCLVLSTLAAQVRWLNMKVGTMTYGEDDQGE